MKDNGKQFPRLELWWRFQRRFAVWVVHLIAFVLALSSMNGINPQEHFLWIDDKQGMSPILLIGFLVWFMALLIHTGSILLRYIRILAISREMKFMMKWQSHEFIEKPKNDVRLTDDGELMEELEQEMPRKSKMRSR